MEIKSEDKVIVPTYTFTATAEIVRYLGANPVFVDSLPDSLNIDPEAIRKAIPPKTKATTFSTFCWVIL
ncbi:DegT/DnrJ/EryC1/StrS family aminotransferase [Xenorhabdus nematophila]|uniref:DegT/DnrJ/EryC1/StrS family aminotransferase n=1 Tax=Xenorhabdus nematophila TaxID=628 RepID=UPI0032B7A8A6